MKKNIMRDILGTIWILTSLYFLIYHKPLIALIGSASTLFLLWLIKTLLKRKNKNTQPLPPSIKEEVLKRQGYACGNCQVDLQYHPYDFHHIVPRGKGGSNNGFNVVALCPICHALIHRNNNH